MFKKPFCSITATTIPLFLSCTAFSVYAAGSADNGQWQILPAQMSINPIHASLLNNGKILIVAGTGNDATEKASRAALYDWKTGSINFQTLTYDMFCNGMASLPDGQVLVVGGTTEYDPFYGESRASLYNPITNTFAETAKMAAGRWYATATSMGDGSIMAFAGILYDGIINSMVESFSTKSGWTLKQNNADFLSPSYPWAHLLPNGKVFISGSSPYSNLYDPAADKWSVHVAVTNSMLYRDGGSSVLLPLDPADNYKPRVMIMGGKDPDDDSILDTASTEMIDLSLPEAEWEWQSTGNMSAPRRHMGAVLLPNGQVFVEGGYYTQKADIFDPATKNWKTVAEANFPRVYHNVSLLLPDATVWVAGGNPAQGEYTKEMEIYKPPYLFTDTGTPASRPVITNMTSQANYGGKVTIDTNIAADIKQVVLIRLGSTTHAFDTEQRMIKLNFARDTTNGSRFFATMPPQANIAPPGYYMVFILNNNGVPSVAKILQLKATANAGLPKVKLSNLTGNGVMSGQANFQIEAKNIMDAPMTYKLYDENKKLIFKMKNVYQSPIDVSLDTHVLSDGVHTIYAAVKDSKLNEIISKPMQVTINNQ